MIVVEGTEKEQVKKVERSKVKNVLTLEGGVPIFPNFYPSHLCSQGAIGIVVEGLTDPFVILPFDEFGQENFFLQINVNNKSQLLLDKNDSEWHNIQAK